MKRFALLIPVLAVLVAAPLALAGRLDGPGYSHSIVPANTTKVYTDWFVAGQRTIITLSGDGNTNLDIFVYDENGNLIVSHTGIGDQAVVSFVPKWTGAFTIKVVNRGAANNQFTLRTN